ncbi:MAG TPA: hypothetical protein VGH99_05380 [Pseudonocardia sp.]
MTDNASSRAGAVAPPAEPGDGTRPAGEAQRSNGAQATLGAEPGRRAQPSPGAESAQGVEPASGTGPAGERGRALRTAPAREQGSLPRPRDGGRPARTSPVTATPPVTAPTGAPPPPRQRAAPVGGAAGAKGPDLAEQLRRLGDRVQRLERALSGAADEAELDTPDAELVTLAEAAEYGQTLTRVLISPRVREACEQTIETWLAWQRRYEEVTASAVTASRVIATTGPGQERHRKAAEEFTAARAELAKLEARRRHSEITAHNARAQLDHDQEVRERYHDEMVAGDQAWEVLLERLRARVGVTLARGNTVPPWLRHALGRPGSPAPARWRELAAQLVAYRLTYSVTDQLSALGEAPTSDDSPRQRRWHRTLNQQLEAWRPAGGGLC